ncbi:MAG: NADH-quinone oxidoreductase subunit J [Planctomycetota bacterium]
MSLVNFILVGAIGATLGVFLTFKPLYSLLYLLLFTLFTGILYISLGFELIGIIQILLYGGAIVVFLLFMVSFLPEPHYRMNFSSLLKFTLFIILWIYMGSVLFTKIPPITLKYIPLNKELIVEILERYILVFELISLLFILIPIFFYFAKKDSSAG